MTELDERPRFYEGQYLEAADLMAAVDYTRVQRARILLGGHRWGIALGLDLMEVPGPNDSLDVVVQPGYAWDGFGRPIVVPEPAKLSPALFASFDASVLPGSPPPPPLPVEVWIRYDEALGQGPRPGFESCEPGVAFSRVSERYVLEAGPRPELERRRSPIEIAGRTLDAAQALHAFDPTAPDLADATVPHQTLPGEDQHVVWLLPLGVVRYQPGTPGKLVPGDAATKAQHRQSRQYAGVVAGSVEATGGVVRVHDRAKPYSAFRTDELLCVEGDIRSDGDVRIFGRRLEFVASPAESPRVPFHVLRRDDPSQGSGALTLVIGDKSTGHNKLVVGRKTGVDAAGADLYAPLMVVTDKGNVGIGTEEPKTLLHLGENGLQIGTSAAQEDNFYVQSNTDGPRALRFYNKDVGAGVPLMSLTSAGRLGLGVTAPTNRLHVTGALGIRANSLYLSGDARWSSLSFNAHHDEGNGAWVFPDPSKPVATIEMDAVSGFPRFEVFTSPVGNNQTWLSRLLVNGHTGDVGLAHSGGNVGIGTSLPAARLDVRGDVVASGDVRLAGLTAMATATKVRVVWGAVGPNGAVTAGDGFTVQRPGGAGRYQVTFAATFTAQPTMLVTRVHELLTANDGNAVTASETAVVDQLLADRAVVATADKDGTRADGGFTFVAIGPR